MFYENVSDRKQSASKEKEHFDVKHIDDILNTFRSKTNVSTKIMFDKILKLSTPMQRLE